MQLREDNQIRKVKDTNGKTYRIQKEASGFGEMIIFYDNKNNVIEEFLPDTSVINTQNIYENEKNQQVHITGQHIRTTFTFEQWFND